MADLLSIFIPTYNRCNKLAGLLEKLDKCLPSQVSVNVINNCSTDGTKDKVYQIKQSVTYTLNYFENVTNIGANANILRCIEYCTTKWLWIIGDDDTPSHDCWNTLEKTLMNPCNSNLCYVNFSCPGVYKRNGYVESEGLADFMEKLDSYSNVLFISTCIFNATYIKPHLRLGYNYIYSLSPHIAILFETLQQNSGLKAVLSPKEIIKTQEDEVKTEKWSYFNLLLGLSTLCEMFSNADPSIVKNFKKKIISYYTFFDGRLFFYIIKYYHNDPFKRKYLFNQIVFRNFCYYGHKSLKTYFNLLLYGIIINSEYLLKLFIKFKKINFDQIGYNLNVQPLHNRL